MLIVSLPLPHSRPSSRSCRAARAGTASSRAASARTPCRSDRRSHQPREVEEADAGSDGERRERVPHRVGRALVDARRVECRGPLVAPPGVQVEIAVTLAVVDERRVQAPRVSLERCDDASPQRDAPQRARLLPVVLHSSVRVDAGDVQNAGAGVDVAALEREPLFRSQPVPATRIGSERRSGGSSAASRSSSSHDPKMGTARRRGSGLGTSLATFSDTSFVRRA